METSRILTIISLFAKLCSAVKKHFYLHIFIPTICEATRCKLSLVPITATHNFWLMSGQTSDPGLKCTPSPQLHTDTWP